MRPRWYWAWGTIDEGSVFVVRYFGLLWFYRPAERLWAYPPGPWRGWYWGGWNLD